MKKIYCFLFVLFIIETSFALTNITTSNVSGTWNMAGSPYIVQVDINVPANQTLVIQPGVEVLFYPGKRFNINGMLVAKGTAAQYIVFKSTDTVGWSVNNNPAGGWSGIHYLAYNGNVTDTSAFDYCEVKDCKYGFAGAVQEVNPFLVYRKLKIKNCIFQHNTTGTGFYVGGDVILLNSMNATDTIEMSNCEVYDNISFFGIVRVNNYMGGFTYIHHNRLHHNIKGSPLWATWVNLNFEYNELDNNEMINDSAPFKMSIGQATVRYNKVHHNDLDQLAAIGCRSGKVDIDYNFIYNNHQKDGACGATGGGGGIHLAHNEGGADFANTFYRVRNNIIANNRGEFGGGAIYVYHAKADICNNTIVGNSAVGLGQAIGILDNMSEVKIKNNLFYGHRVQMVDSFYLVFSFSANKIYFDYNYIHAPFYKTVTGNYTTLVGDSSHNIIGFNPMMVNPTTNNLLATNAANYNFDLLAGSPCINNGDSSGSSPTIYDYAGNNRIINNKIDIGAYEFNKNTESVNDHNEADKLFNIYPNPANQYFIFESKYNNGEIAITDLSGKIIFTEKMKSDITLIDIAQWQKGIYIIKYTSKDKAASTKLLVY